MGHKGGPSGLKIHASRLCSEVAWFANNSFLIKGHLFCRTNKTLEVNIDDVLPNYYAKREYIEGHFLPTFHHIPRAAEVPQEIIRENAVKISGDSSPKKFDPSGNKNFLLGTDAANVGCEKCVLKAYLAREKWNAFSPFSPLFFFALSRHKVLWKVRETL